MTLSPRAAKRLRIILAAVHLGWALWALIGGFYFLTAREVLGTDTTLVVLNSVTHGYSIVGWSLMACGVISLLGVAVRPLRFVAATLCGVWCAGVALFLSLATPGLNQADIDAWLLLMCAFTCVMRWALLALEPHVCE